MTRKVLTFYIGDILLGINVTLVKEINRNAEYTPVPDAQPHILGLFNMRGQVVTIINLAKLLSIEEQKQHKLTCIILKVPKDPDQVGFLIDSPGDVMDIDDEECELPPANANGLESEYISSVVKLQDELLIIIDPDKIFNRQQETKQ